MRLPCHLPVHCVCSLYQDTNMNSYLFQFNSCLLILLMNQFLHGHYASFVTHSISPPIGLHQQWIEFWNTTLQLQLLPGPLVRNPHPGSYWCFIPVAFFIHSYLLAFWDSFKVVTVWYVLPIALEFAGEGSFWWP